MVCACWNNLGSVGTLKKVNPVLDDEIFGINSNGLGFIIILEQDLMITVEKLSESALDRNKSNITLFVNSYTLTNTLLFTRLFLLCGLLHCSLRSQPVLTLNTSLALVVVMGQAPSAASDQSQGQSSPVSRVPLF